jgi:hypothetical protein
VANIFEQLAGEVIEGLIKGAVTKAVQGLAAKGEITPAQEPVLVAGVMIEVQIALETYQSMQAKNAATAS